MFGPITHDINKALPDLNLREYAVLLPLVALAFWIGIYPKPFFAYIEMPVQRIVQQVNPGFYQADHSQPAISQVAVPASEVK
jgi:NADH-quinone oxidoreductase subunit M